MKNLASPDLAADALRQPFRGLIKNNLRDYGLLLSLIVIMGFFQIKTDGVLMQPLNITNLVLQNSYIVVMALGMLLVIVAGHIDLSVGSVCGFIGGLAAVLIVQFNWGVVPTVLVSLTAGGLIGAAQGWFVAYARIPAFIVTLAGMLVFKGLELALLQGQSVGPFPTEFQRISTGFLPDPFGGENLRVLSLVVGLALVLVLIAAAVRQRIKARAHGIDVEPLVLFVARNVLFAGALVYLSWLMSLYRGIPDVLILMVALILVYQFVTNRTTIGRRIYALGGNEKATRLSGVNTARLSFLTFVNMGVLAAVAGLIFAARLNTATPKAGLGFELDVIAACFIGGASASGGVGKVVGAVIGAFIMGVMNNGMSIMGIGIDYQQVIKGLVLLAAVLIDVYNRNRA
ncbi:multiple monosaccharide ABC transporter permease [Paraburkholderia dinghuensis]|uniref:Xylose transport system permease protein XylH n=1 Tax=Paraburkholderia dinghuensis TaxID=2305225 RepID=A0A3N6PRV8_9BURK|nr:multiple monosaccharide ABC transporter permease [Paraburkholderia dinghuensis]RQH02176.1 sugar ABC transporter permease [Paraburkholderia dinghuensis]